MRTPTLTVAEIDAEIARLTKRHAEARNEIAAAEKRVKDLAKEMESITGTWGRGGQLADLAKLRGDAVRFEQDAAAPKVVARNVRGDTTLVLVSCGPKQVRTRAPGGSSQTIWTQRGDGVWSSWEGVLVNFDHAAAMAALRGAK